jgi:hypothetical protein
LLLPQIAANHKHAISLFIAAYNFCKVHSTLGCTPAVGLKLATETWTIEKLIEEATKKKSENLCFSARKS